jgi:microcystin-dependent protein
MNLADSSPPTPRSWSHCEGALQSSTTPNELFRILGRWSGPQVQQIPTVKNARTSHDFEHEN